MELPSLDGLFVLDLSRVLAGPWCTQILADLGATVVKVERPGAGDDTRHWGPPFVEGVGADSRGDAAYYLGANRGKFSIEIDMGSVAGRELLRDLASRADVLVENFKTGSLARYGLDYETLANANRGLVYCSITGFGQTGADRERAGYDLIVQAMSGLMSITGRPDGEPGSGPLKVGVAVSDLFAGLYATIGILASLRERERSGRGQHVDVALLGAQVATLANQAMNFLVGGLIPPRLGNAHPNIVPYQAFRTEDGEMVVAVGNDSQFGSFCNVLGLSELPVDARFAGNADRVANRDLLVGLIEERLRESTTSDWVERLDAAGIPCGPIRTLDQVFEPVRDGARPHVHSVERANGLSIPTLESPIKLSRTPVTYAKAPPTLGEDTEIVLREFVGLDPVEIEALADRGAFGPGRSRGYEGTQDGSPDDAEALAAEQETRS